MLSSTLPVQIWARRPAVANAWLGTMAEIHERGVLPERLRELVRIVELHLFSGLMLAGGRMTYVLKGYEDKPD